MKHVFPVPLGQAYKAVNLVAGEKLEKQHLAGIQRTKKCIPVGVLLLSRHTGCYPCRVPAAPDRNRP